MFKIFKKNRKSVFIVVQFLKHGMGLTAIDYPKNILIPNVGDRLTMEDMRGVEHSGTVIKKRFVIRKSYIEIGITVETKL